MKLYRLLIFALLISQSALAQKKGKTKDQSILAVNLTVSYQNTAGDLAKRFGTSTGYGGGLDYITSKNWIFGANGNFLFGNNVGEDVLAPIRNSSGTLVANNGFVADIGLRMRAYYVDAHIGKLIPFGKKTSRSGLRITFGTGYFQHKIRLQDDPEAPVASLTNEYKKGYDRKSAGLSFTEFIGYQYFANNRRINFYAGIELTQGITKSLRGYNYDLQEADTDTRFDMLYGVRVGWILPFYFGESNREEWY